MIKMMRAMKGLPVKRANIARIVPKNALSLDIVGVPSVKIKSYRVYEYGITK